MSIPEDDLPDFLTLKQAGKYLGLSRDTVRRYLHLHLLEGWQYLPRGQWRIPKESIVKFKRGEQ